jgi:uncharacterized membrane protein
MRSHHSANADLSLMLQISADYRYHTDSQKRTAFCSAWIIPLKSALIAIVLPGIFHMFTAHYLLFSRVLFIAAGVLKHLSGGLIAVLRNYRHNNATKNWIFRAVFSAISNVVLIYCLLKLLGKSGVAIARISFFSVVYIYDSIGLSTIGQLKTNNLRSTSSCHLGCL